MKWDWTKFLIALLPYFFPCFSMGEAVMYIKNNDQLLDAPFYLKGEWDFSWQKFQGSFPESDHPDFIQVKVPGYWKGYEFQGEKLPGVGYGTYHLKVVLPSGFRNPMAIYFPSVDVAYKVFLDDRLVYQCGIPSKDKKRELPKYHPHPIYFQPCSDTLSLLVEVSNFSHRRGGIWEIPYIAEKKCSDRYMNRHFLSEVIVLCVLFSFGIFFLLFSFFYRKERAVLYFAITIICVFCRGVSINQATLAYFSSIPWHYVVRLEYISIFSCLLFGLWGFYYLIPIPQIYRLLKMVSFGLIPVYLLLILSPVSVFSYTIFIFYSFLGLGIVFFAIQMYHLQKKASRLSKIYVVSLVFMLLGTLHDVLISNSIQIVLNFYILPYVFIFFILAQSIDFFKRFALATKTSESLSTELKILNQSLEQKIEERTLELAQNKLIIENQNKTLQNDLFFKNRLFSILGHDIRGPLASIIQGLEIVGNENSSEASRQKIAKKLKIASNSLLILVENLLSWGLNQNGQLKISPEVHSLLQIVKKVVNQISSLAEDKKIVLEVHVPPSVSAWFDEVSVSIVLRNLIVNAIKFTPQYGTVSLRVEEKGNEVTFCVSDTGIGMDEDMVNRINLGNNVKNHMGTNQEWGTGLGLMLCKDLVSLNKGSFSVRSTLGQGSSFCFTLPLVAS